jgi:hypothetical protein
MKIALLAKGPTLSQFSGEFDEVWGLNQVAQTHELDRAFVMDDLKLRLPYYDGNEFPEWLKGYSGRLITSKAYPEWPTSEDYPLMDVVRTFGIPLSIACYSTVDWMIALAIHEGVGEIHLFGVDCVAPGLDMARCSAAIWIGAAMSRGIRVTSKQGSAFTWWTNTGICMDQGFYGYVGRPRIESLVESSQAA